MSSVLADNSNQQFRFSVKKFNELAESGVIPMETRLELIDGVIYEMHPLGPYHCSISRQIGDSLRENANSGLLVSEEKPVILDDFSEPIPDLSLVKKREGDPYFGKSHPVSNEIILLIEVSDSSYIHDRNVKLASYAKSGIPEVWIVNTGKKQIEWFSQPDSGKSVFMNEGVFASDEVIDRGDFSLDLSKIVF